MPPMAESDLESRLDKHLVEYLEPRERERLTKLLARAKPVWSPQDGPQTEAYHSPADVTGYGGAAGGGKTDLALGLALTQHQKIGFFRQTGTELTAVIDRLEQILGSRDGFRGQDKIWRWTRADGTKVQLELGAFPNPGDEKKYQGRPHDLLVFDEAANIRESAMRFVSGWLRTEDTAQRKRTVMCFNPPTTTEGRWVVKYFAPWLDDKHPKPAEWGEIRWFVSLDNDDLEVDGPEQLEIDGKMRTPHSRTFIQARVRDNKYYANTGYEQHLDSLPEPLRSQMKDGNFRAGMEDDTMQVIPTAWVEAAMERWQRKDVKPEMHSMGVDVAMGGRDKTVIARRHGFWFDEPIVYESHECRDEPRASAGGKIAGFVIAALRDRAPIHVDLFGPGAAPHGHLMRSGHQSLGVNVGDPSGATSVEGSLRFFNKRTELWWKMREALQPSSNTGIALPQSRELLADLCAPLWKLHGGVIKVEGRDDIVKRLGRSPDYASAYCLALMETLKIRDAATMLRGGKGKEWDPFAQDLGV